MTDTYPMKTIDDVKNVTPERFWSKIKFGELNECWEWQAARDKDSYGVSDVKAHRYIYEKVIGLFDKKLQICHTCDNPPCVNPNHLFAGTHRDNLNDSIKKGRRKPNPTKGSQRPNAKLKESDIPLIQKRLANGEMIISIAESYNVSPGAISQVKHHRRWKHVKIEANAI